MKKLIAIAAAAALAVPAAAQAKGPDEAKIAGPGVGRTIVLNISGYGESGKGTMGRLTTEGGFFPQVFGDWPDPRLPKKPANLGPRYRVDYHMPGPTAPVTLHQDLYPYASSGLVTYMRTGQRFWSGPQTKVGWMRVPELAPGQETLRAALIKAGLPKTAPARNSDSAQRTVGWVAGMAAAALAAGALLAPRRRESSPSAARKKPSTTT